MSVEVNTHRQTQYRVDWPGLGTRQTTVTQSRRKAARLSRRSKRRGIPDARTHTDLGSLSTAGCGGWWVGVGHVSRGSDSRAAWWATVAWKRQSRTTEGHHLPALHANHHVALRFARQPGGNVRELARDVGVVDIVGRAVCHEDDRRHPRACYRDETRSGNREKIARSFEVASNLRDDNGNAFRGREVLSLSTTTTLWVQSVRARRAVPTV